MDIGYLVFCLFVCLLFNDASTLMGDTLCVELLLQFNAESFELLQMLLTWSGFNAEVNF